MQIKKLQWQQTLAIRHEVLWPDKPQAFCHVDGDEPAWHYGVYIDKTLVCVASIYPGLTNNTNDNNDKSARLRKFATLTHYQNQGIGSFILSHIIDSLKAKGIENFWCDARESAFDFYRRFGLETEGQRFYKEDIPYIKMRMKIN